MFKKTIAVSRFYAEIEKDVEFLLSMMIDEALAEVISERALPKDEPLLQTKFDLILEEKTHFNVLGFLFSNYIIIRIESRTRSKGTEESVLLRIKFSFELIFTIIGNRENPFEGDPVEIKFESFNKCLILRNVTEPEELMKWKKVLAQKLNQRGFHELFRPVKKIGKGNFASVFLVNRIEDGKPFAVKAFSKEATFGEERGKESLINEINVMRRVRHKNLMKLYEIFESENSIYVNVELLQGGQLYDKIKQKHRFSAGEIKSVMRGILEGLEAMHSENIMHRDLKPENILLRSENDFDCVIADFGLAEEASTPDYIFVRCGTPGYVAPEVVNLKDMKAKYTPICDLFSLGVIFHLLVLRKSPFPGREYEEVLSQNRACKFDFDAPEYTALDPVWLNLMRRLLEKDPKKRINASEALNHEFFAVDAQLNPTRQRGSLTESKGIENGANCNSPLLPARNNERKNIGRLKEDSCLKFKMKENIMTGRTDHNETPNEIDSPGIKKRTFLRGGAESRFKQIYVKE